MSVVSGVMLYPLPRASCTFNDAFQRLVPLGAKSPPCGSCLHVVELLWLVVFFCCYRHSATDVLNVHSHAWITSTDVRRIVKGCMQRLSVVGKECGNLVS